MSGTVCPQDRGRKGRKLRLTERCHVLLWEAFYCFILYNLPFSSVCGGGVEWSFEDQNLLSSHDETGSPCIIYLNYHNHTQSRVLLAPFQRGESWVSERLRSLHKIPITNSFSWSCLLWSTCLSRATAGWAPLLLLLHPVFLFFLTSYCPPWTVSPFQECTNGQGPGIGKPWVGI